MNFVFLMDPLHTVNMKKDTSFILMIGAHRKGHKVFFLPEGGLTLKNGRLSFKVTKVTPQQIENEPFIKEEQMTLTDSDVDAVLIRTDPPFDYEYLMQTWLLDKLPQHIPVINHPNGIRSANEKIWATEFTSLLPPTLVGRNKDELLKFLKEEQVVVAKPTDGFGGKSVFIIKQGDVNTNVIFETLTKNFTEDIIVQKYVAGASDGDKRIILLNGEPLGAVLRVHSADDHRNNFFSGGKAVAADIDRKDYEIIELLKPKLKELGLYFVGIDVLDGFLIEVNVTSPTCLQEINALNNAALENQVIEFIENLIEEKKMTAKINV